MGNKKRIIQDKADYIIKMLQTRDFVIQRYDSYTSDSVYIKLDYGVANSIRISDHEGKSHLRYRYNVIIGGEDNIIEDEYIRYYFNESSIDNLLNQILFDKTAKIAKYGAKGYNNLMNKNLINSKGSAGFWSKARTVFTPDIDCDVTVQMPKNRQKPESAIKVRQMPDGIIGVGPVIALDFLGQAIENQHQIDANAKFGRDEQVQVTASFEELVNYYMNSGEKYNEARTHALKVQGRPGYNVGTNLGATKCDEGMFYTVELPLVPMEFLPERFIARI